jgi:hypothetical protein
MQEPDTLAKRRLLLLLLLLLQGQLPTQVFLPLTPGWPSLLAAAAAAAVSGPLSDSYLYVPLTYT